MKHGKKPTVRQSEIIKASGLEPDAWLIERETQKEMVIVHRYADTTRTITKTKGD